VPGIVHEVLRSPGQPLDALVRNDMEQRFGHDFSMVRVHTDAKAAVSTDEVSAQAYTIGNHIAFGPGKYEPGIDHGRRLLAHELTHVVQQHGQASRLAGTTDDISGVAETEAKIAADSLSDFSPLQISPVAEGFLRRQRILPPPPAPPPVVPGAAVEGGAASAAGAALAALAAGAIVLFWPSEIAPEGPVPGRRRQKQCRAAWGPPAGGNAIHDEYARYVAMKDGNPQYATVNYWLEEDGLIADFDHHNPDIGVNEFFEVKTRHEILMREWARSQPMVQARLIEQATRQVEILNRCALPGWRLIWYFDDWGVYDAARDWLTPIVDEVRHVPWDRQLPEGIPWRE
jgi:hypothetical protein